MSALDVAPAGVPAGSVRRHDWRSQEAISLRRRRYAADGRLKAYGITAIAIALGLLGLLLISLVSTGYKAFTQTMYTVEVNLDPSQINRDDLIAADWRGIVNAAILAPVPGLSPPDRRAYLQMMTQTAAFLVRDEVIRNPDLIGKTMKFTFPMADPIDQLNKGDIDRNLPPDQRRVSDKQIAWFDAMVERGAVSKPFNWGFFLNMDSRFPELAGLGGATIGSFLTVLICMLLSVPAGVATAVYLEEFAPKNKITDLIEVNINNLAAVPSIVFGLLALAVFLNFFGLPRGAPLVGGMALALTTLPLIVIVTRNALKSIPNSIREAALGVGASKHEMVMDHVLPLAAPSILTGAIIGLALAVGETAPLLLIGMNAFITSPPEGIMSASTVLPTQIFIWADSPERGFVARTSAGILMLLAFIMVMNGIAIYLRKRFERQW